MSELAEKLQAELDETKLKMVRQRQILMEMNGNQCNDLERLKEKLAQATLDLIRMGKRRRQWEDDYDECVKIIGEQDAEITRLKEKNNEESGKCFYAVNCFLNVLNWLLIKYVNEVLNPLSLSLMAY
jgi:hypothetical protein